MNQLSFTLQHRRSLKTLRLQYGLEGMKYIIQMYEGEINGHGENESLPTEYQYEFEQEMLWNTSLTWKRNSERKDGLRGIYHRRFINPHSLGVTNQMENWYLSLNDSILLILLILFLFYPSRNSTTIYIICPIYRNILITILLTNLEFT